MKILFATKNKAKLSIYQDAFDNLNVEVITVSDLPHTISVEETGINAIENAKLKAKQYYDEFGYITFAEDDSLFIDKLPVDKQPGNEIKRFTKEQVTDVEILNYYADLIKEIGGTAKARVIKGAAIFDGTSFFTFESETQRVFVDKPSNTILPGYPLSSLTYYQEKEKYLSEFTPEEVEDIGLNEAEGIHLFINKTINLIKLVKMSEETFEQLIKGYDHDDKYIDLKATHSLRVGRLSLYLATKLKLNTEEINVAYLIGLLHDIGRFEQSAKFKTFNDYKSFDHGDYGSDLLIKEDFIKHFDIDETYYNIVDKAIRNHNKLNIEEGLNPRELFFAQLIRDVDKLDIYYQGTYRDDVFAFEENDQVNPEVIEEFTKYKNIDTRNVISKADKNFHLLAMVFNLNFKESKQYLKEQKYIETIYNKFKKSDDIDKVYNEVMLFLNK